MPAVERIDDGTAVNPGTTERLRDTDSVELAMDLTGQVRLARTRRETPTGPFKRVASTAPARTPLEREPKVSFYNSLRRAWESHRHDRDPAKVREMLAGDQLKERRVGSGPLRAGHHPGSSRSCAPNGAVPDPVGKPG